MFLDMTDQYEMMYIRMRANISSCKRITTSHVRPHTCNDASIKVARCNELGSNFARGSDLRCHNSEMPWKSKGSIDLVLISRGRA